MFNVNDRSVGYVNGERGVVVGTNPYVVESDWGQFYRLFSTDRLERAYCTTVHKAQGGEAARVALLCTESSLRHATREMIYTALSRARQSVMLVGEIRWLREALGRVSYRTTLLGSPENYPALGSYASRVSAPDFLEGIPDGL